MTCAAASLPVPHTTSQSCPWAARADLGVPGQGGAPAGGAGAGRPRAGCAPSGASVENLMAICDTEMSRSAPAPMKGREGRIEARVRKSPQAEGEVVPGEHEGSSNALLRSVQWHATEVSRCHHPCEAGSAPTFTAGYGDASAVLLARGGAVPAPSPRLSNPTAVLPFALLPPHLPCSKSSYT